jgi:hypothetical protein
MSSSASPLQFAPGESPFHCKGMIWLGIQLFIDQFVPGGRPAVLAQLSHEHATFLSELFVAPGWYDLLPINPVADGIAAAMKVDRMEYVRRNAQWAAEQDLAGVYKALLRSATPLGVCHRFASIYAQHYDFGKAQVVKEQSNQVEALASGMPEAVAWWWKRASECYLVPVLRAAGARSPRLTWVSTESDGRANGVPLVRIRSLTTWDAG